MPNINRKELTTRAGKKRSEQEAWNEYHSYYNNPAWRDLRNYYLRRNPLCEVCLEHGRVVPAEHVHHKLIFARGRDERHKEQLLLNEENLISVCKKCHQALHKKDNGMNVLDSLTDDEYSKAHQLEFMV